MDALVLLGLLVLGLVALTPLAERVGVPQPVLLTVYGIGLGLVPGLPAPDLAPELILPLVLPPLLFAATQATSVRELAEAARPVLGLAVGLTLLSAAVVAVVAHAFGFGWGVAAVLGAVVAPPDPVAATAVARRLHLPPRLVTVLEGEGQFNDATALVVYQLAVMAVVAGGVGFLQIGVGLLVAVLGGLAIGLVGGLLARWAVAHLRDPAAETTVTIAVPFALYLLAEHVGASGVLAVLAVGLYLRTTATGQTTSAGWLLGRSVWQYVDFAVSGLLFGFLGIELTGVLRRTPDLGEPSTWTLTAAVVVALVVVRAAAVFTASGLAGRRARRRGSALPAGWRESAVASWAGMRGVVTVATALALPGAVSSGAAFPQRDVVVVIALVVVLVTLVLQGLTLSPLIQKLGVASEVDPSVDVRHLHRLAAQAAVQRLEEVGDDVPEDVRRAVLAQYRSRLDYRTAVEDLVEGSGAGPRLRELLSAASDAEREAVARARRSGEVSPAAADEVLFDIQARALRYEY